MQTPLSPTHARVGEVKKEKHKGDHGGKKVLEKKKVNVKPEGGSTKPKYMYYL